MNKDDNNQTGSNSIHLDQILQELSDRRIESAASSACLMEKSKGQRRILESDDIEERVKNVEEHIVADLATSTIDEVAVLNE